MTQVKEGDTVQVHYTGKLEDGTVFDSSEERAPLEFTVGEGKIIPGFEQMIVGMNPGESKTKTVTADKAYGSYHSELILEVDKSQIPDDVEPKVGQQLQMQNKEDGRIIVATVTDVSDTKITIDGNHPLAGKDLTFDVQLVEIV